MCKAWDGAMQMYADEAREEMKKQQAEKNRRVVSRMFSKGYPQAEIADMLEIPLKTVKRWCAGLTQLHKNRVCIINTAFRFLHI